MKMETIFAKIQLLLTPVLIILLGLVLVFCPDSASALIARVLGWLLGLVAIGFGISTPEQAKKMAALSDGAIVGSAIIKILAEYGTDAPTHVGEYIRTMKDAVTSSGM